MSCEIDRFLQACADRTTANLSLIYRKQDSPEELMEVIRYASLDGGKSIRPSFVYAVAELCECPEEKADDIASAVELIHSYSLIHDDLPSMDDDDFRRGKYSVHKKFGEARAILAGDAMQAMAFETLAASASLDAEQKVEMVKLLTQAVGVSGMSGGQTLDIVLKDKAIDINTVENLHRMKTGSLFKACNQMSAFCGTNKIGETPEFEKFADNIGLCFQIRDDIIDSESNSDEAGISPTYPSVLGLEKSERELLRLRDLCLNCLTSLGANTRKLDLLTRYITERHCSH